MRQILLAVLFIYAAVAAAQDAPPPQAPDLTTLSIRTSLVVVPTSVRTKAGGPVFTLKAQDFTVLDDGVPQKARLEEDSDSQPLALVVVVEAGGDGANKLEQYKGLGTMIEVLAGGVQHKLALVGFDSEPALVQPWTESFERMDQSIADLGPGDQKDAILDALTFSVDLLSKQPSNYRRAILLVSETVDHGSHTRIEDALRAVSDTNTVIYSLGFSSTRAEVGREAGKFSSTDPGPPNGCMGYDPNLDAQGKPQPGKVSQAYDCLSQLAPPLRLAKIALMAALGGFRTNVPQTSAKLTGGEYFHFEDARTLERDLQAITNRLPNRYFLSFIPSQPHPGLHAVSVTLKDYSGLVVEARRSYWAEGAPVAESEK